MESPGPQQEIFRQKAVDGDATFAIAYALMELAKKLNLHGVRTELKGAGVELVYNGPPKCVWNPTLGRWLPPGCHQVKPLKR